MFTYQAREWRACPAPARSLGTAAHMPQASARLLPPADIRVSKARTRTHNYKYHAHEYADTHIRATLTTVMGTCAKSTSCLSLLATQPISAREHTQTQAHTHTLTTVIGAREKSTSCRSLPATRPWKARAINFNALLKAMSCPPACTNVTSRCISSS